MQLDMSVSKLPPDKYNIDTEVVVTFKGFMCGDGVFFNLNSQSN